MSIDHIISDISNSRIRKVILIGNDITLLDYKTLVHGEFICSG